MRKYKELHLNNFGGHRREVVWNKDAILIENSGGQMFQVWPLLPFPIKILSCPS